MTFTFLGGIRAFMKHCVLCVVGFGVSTKLSGGWIAATVGGAWAVNKTGDDALECA